MGAQKSILVELEEAVARGDGERRVELLRSVTDLFLNDAERLSDEQVHLFDDVIGRLAEEIETNARRELSERLAPVENAPVGVVENLAADDAVEVASPVLTRSKVLKDEFLVEIARTKGQGHLLAISGRDTIAPVVTDVLVDRGNNTVLRTVAGNQGAQFSDRGFGRLVERSKDDEVLAEKVGLRADIPARHFQAILGNAKEQVRKRLAGSIDETRIKAALDQVGDAFAERLTPKARDFTAAQREILGLKRMNRLDEESVFDIAKTGRVEPIICALAIMAGVQIAVVERLFDSERPDGVLLLARSSGLSWPTLKAILMMRVGAAGTSTAAMAETADSYEKLTVATAQRAIRFWQVRQSTQTPG